VTLPARPQPDALRTRATIEDDEARALAPYAERASASRGRAHPSEPHPYRTAFQQDRDRIIHTTAFRRLQYKTQVFINYEGDYYRTRLTHTYEAAQIARTIARALGANMDLVEAVTLAHDLGHSTFGHSGEATLDRIMLERAGLDPADPANRGRGFNHTVQSLRIVERLEHRWRAFPGLNLTWETREGIAKHRTDYDEVHGDWLAPYGPHERPSLEGQIVNYADELTYSAHDLDDGLRSGMIRDDMPELTRLEVWQRAAAGIREDDPELRRHQIIRRAIDLLVSDLVYASAESIAAARPSSPDDVRASPQALVTLSSAMVQPESELKAFLFEHLYRHHRVVRMFRKAERVLLELFGTFEDDYRQLPPRTQELLRAAQPDLQPGRRLTMRAHRVIADYLAGMTDRYALQEHRRLFDPLEPA
jgi:dGTPase